MESFQTSLIFFLYVIWFSFLHPSPRVQVFPSLSFFRKHTPPGFASSTCRFWWAPCCRSSTLLPAVFSSSPPSWSAQDASPWHHLKATVPACFVFFLGTQNRTKKKLRLTLTVLMLPGKFFWGCSQKQSPKNLLFLWKLASFSYDKVVDWSIYPFPVVKPKNGFNNVSTRPPRCAGTNLCRPKSCITLHLPAQGPTRFQRSADSPSIRFPFPQKKDVTVYLQIKCVKEVDPFCKKNNSLFWNLSILTTHWVFLGITSKVKWSHVTQPNNKRHLKVQGPTPAVFAHFT